MADDIDDDFNRARKLRKKRAPRSTEGNGGLNDQARERGGTCPLCGAAFTHSLPDHLRAGDCTSEEVQT